MYKIFRKSKFGIDVGTATSKENENLLPPNTKDYKGFYPYNWEKAKQGIWEIDERLKAEIDEFLKKEEQTQQIFEAKRYLNETDYKALKAFEGYPSADWDEVKQKRQEARDKIRELEA